MLKGDTSENLIGLLEKKMLLYIEQNCNYNIFSKTTNQSWHVKVNGKKVNISSYKVKEEDTIEIRDKSKQLAIIDIALANKEREIQNTSKWMRKTKN